MTLRSNHKTALLVLGVHLEAEGYPNVRYRIRDLKNSPWFETTEINVPMWRRVAGSRGDGVGRVSALLRALFAHLLLLAKYLRHGRAAVVYVPYPAVFVVWGLSWLPRRIRPNRVVLDAFISLYDTVVNDRQLLPPEGRRAALLKQIEKRAFTAADRVIVDTAQSAAYVCREFGLPSDKVVDVPLSTNQQTFHFMPYHPDDASCTVLFIGTFIPLHGLEAIIDAAIALRDCAHIRFRIVGAGQTSQTVANRIEGRRLNLEWVAEWQSSEALAAMIGDADICLGIFGAGNKTQRVCPFKIYNYAACGRAIVTGDTEWIRFATTGLGYRPFETVPVNDGAMLAQAISRLAESGEARRQLAKNSRRFYEETLSNEIAMSRFAVLLGASADPVESES